MRTQLLISFILLPGIAGILIFGYFALIDWQTLQRAYQNFAEVAQQSTNLQTVLVAEAQQNIQRINLFADGVWALLSAILAAIGLHGICTLPRRTRT